MESPEKPPSVPIQSVVIQQPQQDQTATPNVVHVQVATSNPLATMSFACGAASFALCLFAFMEDEFFVCLFVWIIGLLAIIFGHIGANTASRTGIGKGFAISGLILGYMTLIAYVAGILVVLSILQSLGN